MIKFLDGASALTPADVIGKFILTEGIFNFRSYRKPGKVTGIAKTGFYVYFEPLAVGVDAINADARSERHVAASSVRAICDTEAEALSLIEASKLALKVMQKHQDACKREIDSLFASLASASGAENE